MTESVRWDLDGAVATITLNRPQARNALTAELKTALLGALREAGASPQVRAVLITGAGQAFCAGGNVKGMGAHRDKKKLEMSFDEKVADLQERQRLLTGTLVSVRKPTIAALAVSATTTAAAGTSSLRQRSRHQSRRSAKSICG